MPLQTVTYVLVAVVVIIAIAALTIIGQFFNLWFQALLSGAPVSFVDLIGMKFHRVDPRVIVLNRIMAVKAGLNISARELEAHYLSGGRVPLVVRALIVARRAQLDLEFNAACAMDLAGQDVFEAVQTSLKNAGLDGPPSSLSDERNV